MENTGPAEHPRLLESGEPPPRTRPMSRGCVVSLAVGGIIATLFGTLIAIGMSAVGSGFCDDNSDTASSCKSDAVTTGASLTIVGVLIVVGIVYATVRWFRNHQRDDRPATTPAGRDQHGE